MDYVVTPRSVIKSAASAAPGLQIPSKRWDRFKNDKKCNNSANTHSKNHCTREVRYQGEAEALGPVLAHRVGVVLLLSDVTPIRLLLQIGGDQRSENLGQIARTPRNAVKK